ncbi:hypothetical protein FAZ15_13945 [Sphingobacterium olei]|uniref:Uncharacterized protein n=1 Tax=Sphingobacterium olei TaxID=2571155 RepID=A0A4U0NYT6_9SPHI|nr:hypothetical protein [Sphingobacterium olei]TJZ59985.1 hypothetical protein FAZ15_13945 [Sphingobacterium olei]
MKIKKTLLYLLPLCAMVSCNKYPDALLVPDEEPLNSSGIESTDNVADSDLFHQHISEGKVASLTYDPTLDYPKNRGLDFQKHYRQYETAMSEKGWQVKTMQFLFNSPTAVTVRTAFSSAKGATLFWADYDFTLSINPANGTTRIHRGTVKGNTVNNLVGQLGSVLPAFDQHIAPYLTKSSFHPIRLSTYIYTATDKQVSGGLYTNDDIRNGIFGTWQLR